MHVRDLLKQGLVLVTVLEPTCGGRNGSSTRRLEFPIIELTQLLIFLLRLLIFWITGLWNQHLVRQTFSPGDADIILRTKTRPNKEDKLIWAYTKSGEYTSKSGYKFLEVAAENLNPDHQGVSPLEKSYGLGCGKPKPLQNLDTSYRRFSLVHWL